MPFRLPGSPHYWYKIRGIRYPTGTADRTEARAIEGRHRAQLHAQQYWDAPPPLALGDCLKLYLEDHRTKRSARQDGIRAVTLLTTLGDESVYDLSPARVQSFVQTRLAAGVRNSTVNRELALLSVSLNYAVKRGFTSVPNPVRTAKLREPEPRTRWLSLGEAAELLRACRESRTPFLADWVLVALHTGCRAGELYGLLWADVAADRLTIRSERAKSGRSRTIPLTPVAVAAIARQPRRSLFVFTYDDGRPATDLREALAHACQRAGIEPIITPHVLRHTCASWLAQAGIPEFQIAAMLGHTSGATTRRYMHLAPEHLAPCVAALAGVPLLAAR